MKTKRVFQSLISALLVCGAVIPLQSQAEVVSRTTASLSLFDTYSGAFGASSSANLFDFQLISLPRFDSALGTLQQVSITIDSYSHSTTFGVAFDDTLEADYIPIPPFIINERNDAYFNAALSTSLMLQLFDPSSSTATFGLPVNSMGCSVSRPDDLVCFDGNEMHTVLNNALAIGSLGLDAFVGTDPINLFATLSSRLSGNCDVDDTGDSCFIQGRVDWIGTVMVTYNYSEFGGGGGGGGSGTVPEPSSLALALLALVIGGLSVKRKC